MFEDSDISYIYSNPLVEHLFQVISKGNNLMRNIVKNPYLSTCPLGDIWGKKEGGGRGCVSIIMLLSMGGRKGQRTTQV